MVLKSVMKQKIEQKLAVLVASKKAKGSNFFECKEVEGLHSIGKEYSVVHLIVRALLDSLESCDAFETGSFERYLKVLRGYVERGPDCSFMQDLRQVYSKTKERSEMVALLACFVLDFNATIGSQVSTQDGADYLML
jgi:hypothetical protein